MAAVEKRKGGYPRGKPRTKPSTGKGQRAGVTLTKKLGAEICERIGSGVPISIAARASGVAANTVHEWERRGRGADERPKTPMTEWFSKEIDKAIGRFVQSQVVKIGSDEAWQSRAWLLERRFPDEFGRPSERLEITGAGGGDIVIRLAFDQTPIAAKTRAELGGPVLDVEAEEIA